MESGLKIQYYEAQDDLVSDLKIEKKGLGWVQFLEPVSIEGKKFVQCVEEAEGLGLQVVEEEWEDNRKSYYICNFRNYQSSSPEEKH